MHYISLVGTQPQAVLNPILALNEQGRRPDVIRLLSTSRTTAYAEILAKYLEKSLGFDEGQIGITTVAASREQGSQGIPSPQHVVTETLKNAQSAVFNLSSGLGFQIVDCVDILKPFDCALIYSSMDCVQEYRFHGSALHTTNMEVPLMPIEDILTLQDVPFVMEPGKKKSSLIDEVLRSAKIKAHSLNNINICDVLFQQVLNVNNTLHFLSVLDDGSKQTQQTELLRQVRKYIKLATSRNDFHELFHRRMYVITKNRMLEARINEEGEDKLTPLLADNQMTLKIAAGKLKSMVTSRKEKPFSEKQETLATGNEGIGKGALYTCLGPNSLPTLIALWSVKPKNVVLFYTPNNATVSRNMAALKTHCKKLPVETVAFVPMGLDGMEILDQPPPIDPCPMVNTTPGAKMQKAILSIWASMHGVERQSHNNSEDVITSNFSDAEYPGHAPAPVDLLKLTGKTLHSFKINHMNMLLKDQQLQGIWKYFQLAATQDISVDSFAVPGTKSTRLNEKITVTFSDQSEVSWSVKDGFWFERIVGRAFALAGADAVQVGLAIDWPVETQKHLKNKYGKAMHMTEMDVVARFGSRYVMISCKATKAKTVGKTADEASCMAEIVGRFCVPMVCFLGKNGEHSENSGVTILGYKDLLDPKHLRQMVGNEFSKRQKTGRLVQA